jgi:hypothetical protein
LRFSDAPGRLRPAGYGLAGYAPAGVGLAGYAPPIATRPPDQPPPPPDRPRHAPGIEANQAHGRIVLVRPTDGGFHLLDELGTRIWELCDGDRSVDQVIETIGAETGQAPAAVAGDVREWIAELRSEQLLCPVAQGAR